MWPGDPEEVGQSWSVVGIEVVRNLLEEVGKGDRHVRSRARDITCCLILDPIAQGYIKARNGRYLCSSPPFSRNT